MKATNRDLKQPRTEVVCLKEEDCEVGITILEDSRISVEEHSFGNVEGGRTQGFIYVCFHCLEIKRWVGWW